VRLRGRSGRVVVGILLLIGVVYFVSGYRFSAIQAAAAHSAVTAPSTMVEQADTGWGRLYVFLTPQGYRTVSCSRSILLWRCPAAVTVSHAAADAVRTIGWTSWTDAPGQQVTFIAVESRDPNVAYIEAGPPESRTRKPITVGTHVVFQWPKAMFLHEIAPIALSAEGKTLYEYRTPNKAHISMPDDLKWYPAPSGT
jgi:hypothetical protein